MNMIAQIFGKEGGLTSNRAVAVLRGDAGVNGVVCFHQNTESEPCVIRGQISGLEPGLHGFHVHQWGDSTRGCESAGPHFNPHGKTHGGPMCDDRHVGDLGNVTAGSDGIAKFEMIDKMITLHGSLSVVGRSLVVHANQDDLGKGVGDARDESLKTGNAGARKACGVISWAQPDEHEQK